MLFALVKKIQLFNTLPDKIFDMDGLRPLFKVGDFEDEPLGVIDHLIDIAGRLVTFGDDVGGVPDEPA